MEKFTYTGENISEVFRDIGPRVEKLLRRVPYRSMSEEELGEYIGKGLVRGLFPGGNASEPGFDIEADNT